MFEDCEVVHSFELSLHWKWELFDLGIDSIYSREK